MFIKARMDNTYPAASALTVVVSAVVYNALLAAAAALSIPVTVTSVIIIESAILLVAFLVSFNKGFNKLDLIPLAFLYVLTIITVVDVFFQEKFNIEMLRNGLIISAFTVLGSRCSEKVVRIAFSLCAIVAFVVLVWEITNLTSYAAAFRPADYLAKTRGYAVKEFYADVGLSVGTLGYASRFSFGLFNGPRTSSIFLEQVGINCFAIVLMVYLVALWTRISIWEKVLVVSTILLIILSNNARMSAIILPVLAIGYHIFDRFPRYINVIIPVVLLMTVAIVFQFETVRIGDDLIGRLGVTYKFITKLTVQDLLVGNFTFTRRAFDTGYGYIIIASSLFGAISYWLYVAFVIPQDSIIQKRTAWAMNTYIYVWLVVGGTASFSMKTASLLWFLVGFVRALPADGCFLLPGDPNIRKASPDRLLGIPVKRRIAEV